MNIVIVGCGKVGFALAEQLCTEGHDIVVVDKSEQALASTGILDVMSFPGNGASYSVLKEAGAARADLLIAVTSADEINMLCCLVGRKLGVKHTIARVRSQEYAEQLVTMKEELGLSMAINPELAASTEIARNLRLPSALKIELFGKGVVELVEIKLEEGSPLIGRALNSIPSKLKVKLLVCAVQRREEVYIPSGDFVLQPGDRIHITASHADMEAVFRALGILRQRVKAVVIVGGGKIAYYLARQVLASGMQRGWHRSGASAGGGAEGRGRLCLADWIR